MDQNKILWIDDEVDMLKPYILFLKQKGYVIDTAVSGEDGLELIKEKGFDIVFLDAHMPGMSGLETLKEIYQINAFLPIIMVTKIDEESLMETAIASKITDYLIKPINPRQILLTLKRVLDKKRLISEQTSVDYQQNFNQITTALAGEMDHQGWQDIYNKLVYWELEIINTNNTAMLEILNFQKEEANANFTKFIAKNYQDWFTERAETRPILSHQLMRKKVFPRLNSEASAFFILIDNLRLDQWRVISPLLNNYFNIVEDTTYYSILPTSTTYARNSIFAGQMPDRIAQAFPHVFFNSENMSSRNLYETTLFNHQLKARNRKLKFNYNKVFNVDYGIKLVKKVNSLVQNQFNILVYNFVDILSHSGKKYNNFLGELAPDEAGYRSLTLSWFKHSYLFDLLKKLANKRVQVFITTDHGTIRVKNPRKIVGSKDDNNALRYKVTNNIKYNSKEGIFIPQPELYRLPKESDFTKYLFAKANDYFIYSNHEYSHYANHYKNTYHHGGVSLEEVIIPFAYLEPK